MVRKTWVKRDAIYSYNNTTLTLLTNKKRFVYSFHTLHGLINSSILKNDLSETCTSIKPIASSSLFPFENIWYYLV